MASDRDIRRVITPEDLIKRLFTPDILICWHLALQRFPQLISLGEALFNHVLRPRSRDLTASAAAITSVAADSLAEELFHCRDEGSSVRQCQGRERQIRGLETAG